MGDFNARVGKNNQIWNGVLGGHGVGQVNSNGIRLLSLCPEFNLTISITLFQQKEKYKTSWMHPRSKHWHLIDYIIVGRANIKDILHTRAMRGAECWTDHRLIMAKVLLQVRPLIRRQKPNLADVETLIYGKNTINEKWTSLSSKLHEAATNAIGYRGKLHQDWFDANSEEIHKLLDELHKSHKATLDNPTSTVLKSRWQALRKEAQSTMRALQNEWWTAKAAEIQRYADLSDMHNFYNAVKTTYGPKSLAVTPLRSADGTTLLKDQSLIVQRWAKHFEVLLNQPSPTDPTMLQELPNLPTLQALDSPPTFTEILKALRSLKNNKAPGPDNIPAEILKQGGYLSTRALHLFISEVWTHGCSGRMLTSLQFTKTKVTKLSVAIAGESRYCHLQVKFWPRYC